MKQNNLFGGDDAKDANVAKVDPRTFVRVPHNQTDTSIAAALSMEEHVRNLRWRVHEEVRRRGDATCDEVEVALDLSHQTASARINELLSVGALKLTAMRRRTRSGRTARVYVAVG